MRGGGGEEVREREARVVGAHEVLADEDDGDASAAEASEVGGGADAGFADEEAWVVDEFGEPEGVGEVDAHGGEVAVVDAEEGVGGVGEADVGLDAEEFVEPVDFEEDGHAELLGEDEEVDEVGLAEAFGDEEDGIGAGGAALVDLPGVEDEVFAEDGEGDGVADASDEGEVAGKERRIGEAGDRRGAVGVIPSGDVFRAEIRGVVFVADPSGGGALAFDLGDDGGLTGSGA